jgi:hypothetical protein
LEATGCPLQTFSVFHSNPGGSLEVVGAETDPLEVEAEALPADREPPPDDEETEPFA